MSIKNIIVLMNIVVWAGIIFEVAMSYFGLRQIIVCQLVEGVLLIAIAILTALQILEERKAWWWWAALVLAAAFSGWLYLRQMAWIWQT
ncbi:MAG: hypothetical protein WC726_01825 [Parcubacteria group bacterium]|jgi:hypothetical protein